MKLNRRLFGAVLMAGALTITSIIGLQPAKAQESVKVGALRLGSHAPSYIAFDRGYFTEAGLDVEFIYFDAAQPMAVAIASGDVDFGLTAISGGLINLAQKGAIKVIGGALQEEPGVDGQVILASKAAYDAGLTSPEKLAGHSFGITQAGSSFHYMAYKIAQKAGFDPKEISLKPLQKVGAIVGALKSGQIDAWSIQGSVGIGLAATPEVEQIGMIADYIPDYQVTTVFTSSEIAANKPELVKSFLAAYSKGVADHNAALVDKTADAAETEAVTKIIAKYIAPDQPYEKASISIQNGAMRINENAKLNLSSVKDQLEWFKSEGLVSGDINIEQLVDTTYVETY